MERKVTYVKRVMEDFTPLSFGSTDNPEPSICDAKTVLSGGILPCRSEHANHDMYFPLHRPSRAPSELMDAEYQVLKHLMEATYEFPVFLDRSRLIMWLRNWLLQTTPTYPLNRFYPTPSYVSERSILERYLKMVRNKGDTSSSCYANTDGEIDRKVENLRQAMVPVVPGMRTCILEKDDRSSPGVKVCIYSEYGSWYQLARLVSAYLRKVTTMRVEFYLYPHMCDDMIRQVWDYLNGPYVPPKLIALE